MPDIVWERPPEPQRAYHRHGAIADELRAHRGQWGRVAAYKNQNTANVAARHIRQGRGAYAPAGDFDAARREIDGMHYVYAVYLGDGDA